MNRIDRLTAIFFLLQSRKYTNASYISEHFEISKRTVFRDMNALLEAGIPITVDNQKGYYIIEGYFLPPVQFTIEEANSLLIGAKLMEKLSDKSADKMYKSALQKIRAVLGEKEKEELEELDKAVKVISRKPATEYADDFLIEIHKAIVMNRRIELDYQSLYKNENTLRIVEPVGVYQFGAGWHLIAFCKLRNDYRDFRLDRIKNFKTLQETFNRTKRKSIDEYFKEIREKYQLHDVKIKFNEKALQQAAGQKYYFGFKNEEKVKDGSVLDFCVHEYSYFAKWLLGFTDNIKIISPDELTEEMKKLSLKISKHFL